MRLFGWEITRPKDELEAPESFAPKTEDDGAVNISAGNATGGSYGTALDLDGTIKSEAELVNKYREMSANPEIDSAIEAITNESIVMEEGQETIELNLDEVDVADNIKKILQDEFKEVLNLLAFKTKGYDLFKRWYIDGRLYFHAVINREKVTDGIQELRYLDPRKIRKIKEIEKKKSEENPLIMTQRVKKEYFLYSEKGLSSQNRSLTPDPGLTGIKIAKDAIIHSTSGLTDVSGKLVFSYMNKAIRPLNQLRAMEDSTIIYRISRAPERRVFYIDVGNLPKHKAEQYLNNMMTRHKNKLVYDGSTGEIKDQRKFMTMIEDYWLPRREGGKGTQIDTLPAGQNLGELADVQYFQRKLYKSLNVPISRLEPETVYNVGRSAEITRDEVAFGKFISRLRTKFSELFLDIMYKQLVLKGLIEPQEWEEIKKDINFRYCEDNHFTELKNSEILAERYNRLRDVVDYAGRYVSHAWIRREILKQDDEEIKLIDKEIKKEQDNPQYAPPEEPQEDAPDQSNGQDLMPGNQPQGPYKQ